MVRPTPAESSPVRSLLDLITGGPDVPNPFVPAPPTPDTPRAAPPARLARIAVRDDRAVAPNARVSGGYPQPVMERIIREAGAAGVPPDLALAMAIREQSSNLANPAIQGGEAHDDPLTLNDPPAWADQNRVEPSMLHAVERASSVAGQGRERQIQAYNGLGAQAPGFNTRFAGQANPYAKAVEEIRTGVVGQSPALQALLAQTGPAPLQPDMSEGQSEAIRQSLIRRAQHPGLWK